MAGRTKTWKRVTLHGSAAEREAAFDKLLADSSARLCYRFVDNGDGTSTVTTFRDGQVAESITRPSEHFRSEVRLSALRYINNVIGELWRERSA